MSIEPVTIDGVNWIFDIVGNPHPICRKHFLALHWVNPWDFELECAECENVIELPRTISNEQRYIKNKIESKEFKKLKFLNLDDEAIPLAEEKLKSPDDKYFVTSKLIKSKVGLRLIVYAGERGKKDKTQIFIEPEIRRIAFDQKDLHPSDVFTKVEATFEDGSKASIERNS